MLEVHIEAKEFAIPGNSPRQILRDVAFKGRPSEVIALLGPSGVGKSTLLRIVLGLDRAFHGSVQVAGAKLGVMFQEPRLLPWLSVEQNLRLVQPTVDVAAVLNEVMLPGTEKLLPSALSLGMARRVALGRALAVDPAMLVLDEPFVSLDRGLGTALGARIAERARKNSMMVLLSTHDIDHALALASRVLVLCGSPATLAWDSAVPSLANVEALLKLRTQLLSRFTFLSTRDAVD